jgi:thioredoxin
MSPNIIEVGDGSFEKDVLESNQPVLVDFWAAWCAPCRIMAPTLDLVADKYAGKALVAKLNVDDNPNIAQRFGIKGIPTFILFKGGKEEERLVGAATQEAIKGMVEKHVTPAATLK